MLETTPALRCRRCNSQVLTPNQDGDLECLCGFVLYVVPGPAPADTRPSAPPPLRELLSPRQRELLHWVAMGDNNRLIAIVMGISSATFKQHLRAIRDRLQLGPGRAELEYVAQQLEEA